MLNIIYKSYFYLLLNSLLLLMATATTCAAQAAEIAGTVELVDGTVWIQGANNKIRPIKADQLIYEGDIIITGKDGELQARMQDNAFIAVRANSKLKIESYRAQGDEEDNAIFSLLIGTFRSVTGWIGKYNRENYAIHTTTATIGVRGTDHEPMFIPPPVPGMKPLGEPGVYDKVNSGRIVMKNKFGESEFGQGQAGFIGLKSTGKAVRLKGIPTFFKPSRNEHRISRVKKQLNQQLQQRLLNKQRLLKQKPSANPNNKPLPKLLNRAKKPSGFIQQKAKPKEVKQPTVKQPRKKMPQEKFDRPERPGIGQPLISPQKPVPMNKGIMSPQTKSFIPLQKQSLNRPEIKSNSSIKPTPPVTKPIQMKQQIEQPTKKSTETSHKLLTNPTAPVAPKKTTQSLSIEKRQPRNNEGIIRPMTKQY